MPNIKCFRWWLLVILSASSIRYLPKPPVAPGPELMSGPLGGWSLVLDGWPPLDFGNWGCTMGEDSMAWQVIAPPLPSSSPPAAAPSLQLPAHSALHLTSSATSSTATPGTGHLHSTPAGRCSPPPNERSGRQLLSGSMKPSTATSGGCGGRSAPACCNAWLHVRSRGGGLDGQCSSTHLWIARQVFSVRLWWEFLPLSFAVGTWLGRPRLRVAKYTGQRPPHSTMPCSSTEKRVHHPPPAQWLARYPEEDLAELRRHLALDLELYSWAAAEFAAGPVGLYNSYTAWFLGNPGFVCQLTVVGLVALAALAAASNMICWCAAPRGCIEGKPGRA